MFLYSLQLLKHLSALPCDKYSWTWELYAKPNFSSHKVLIKINLYTGEVSQIQEISLATLRSYQFDNLTGLCSLCIFTDKN